MAITDLTNVQYQIATKWSPRFTKELREQLLLGSLVNKDYEGEIRMPGDTVRVSQVNAPTGELKTVGTDADTFSPEAFSTSYVDIKANKRAVAAYEFNDLVHIQSLIDQGNPEIEASLRYAMSKQINDYLYSLVSPSASAPDHQIVVTDMNAAAVSGIRKLAAQAKWSMDKGWYLLVDPSYYSDILDDTTLSSSDFGAQDAPMIGGQLARQRFGFNIFEDNSRSTDYGLAFHPDFMHLVMQTEVRTKVSDQHSNHRFGYTMSVDVVFGAKLGISGDVKHIVATGS